MSVVSPIFLTALMLCCFTARAGLEFKSRTVSREIEPSQTLLDVAFPFTNTGRSPVTIKRIKPHCECTEARSERGNTVMPGQSGRILLKVDTKTFVGTVSKDVSVFTSDGTEHKIIVRVAVKEPVTVTPKALSWKQNGTAETRIITLTLAAGCPFTLKRVSLVGSDFEYEPATVTPGKKYTVTVTPKSTGKKLINRLLIETDSKDPRYARIPVFLSIHPTSA